MLATSSQLSVFQNIPFNWQSSDCFTLACTVRSHFDVPPLPDFSHIYQQHPTEDTFPDDGITPLLQQFATPRNGAVQHLDLLALRFDRRICLGTAVVDSGVVYVVFMGGAGSQVLPLRAIGRSGLVVVEGVWVF